MADLEKDFDTVVEQINLKLKEAASAVQEANRLSEEIGLPALISTQWMYDDMRAKNRELSREEISEKCEALQEKLEKINVSELEIALGDGGWSTSSSYC